VFLVIYFTKCLGEFRYHLRARLFTKSPSILARVEYLSSAFRAKSSWLKPCLVLNLCMFSPKKKGVEVFKDSDALVQVQPQLSQLGGLRFWLVLSPSFAPATPGAG